MVQISRFDARQVAEKTGQFRNRRPRVHCITNTVAQNFTANVLLAAGAIPSMTVNPAEIADFASVSDALLINLGTMDRERSHAIEIAVDTVNSLNKPWTLDPVFVHRSSLRLQQAKNLLEKRPALVRCNAYEFEALFEISPNSENIERCAAELGTTIALTGDPDLICSRSGSIKVENGSAQMASITAMGCALAAVMAGFMPLADEALYNATSAAAFFAVAGDTAERNSNGPGSFVPAFLDAIHCLSADELTAGVRLS